MLHRGSPFTIKSASLACQSDARQPSAKEGPTMASWRDLMRAHLNAARTRSGPHPCHLPARSYPVPVKSRRPGKPALARRRQCQSHRTSERPTTARGTAHRPAHPSGGVLADVAAQGGAALGSVEHSPRASRARRVIGHLRRYFTSPPLKANCTVCCKPITHVSASGPERGSPCRAVTRCCYGSN